MDENKGVLEAQSETPQLDKKGKIKKIANIVITVLEAIVVVFMLVVSIFSISTSGDRKNVPHDMFGNVVMSVYSPSMTGTFNQGDIIFSKALTQEEVKKLEKDDVITFWTTVRGQEALNTHRIVEVFVDDVGNVSFKTKGDANSDVDDGVVYAADVVAIWTGGRLPLVGGVVRTVQGSSVLFFFVIIFPMILIFLWNGFAVVKTIMDSKKEKAVEQAKAISDEERKALLEEAKRQALEELKREQEANKGE